MFGFKGVKFKNVKFESCETSSADVSRDFGCRNLDLRGEI